MYFFPPFEQIEINAGRATKAERDFLISPSPGTNFVVKGLMAQSSVLMEVGNSVPAINFGRKPFDWMSDAQWQMMLVRKTTLMFVKRSINQRCNVQTDNNACMTVN